MEFPYDSNYIIILWVFGAAVYNHKILHCIYGIMHLLEHAVTYLEAVWLLIPQLNFLYA